MSVRKKWTLEWLSPNLYGYLVWGGGFHHLAIAAKVIFTVAKYTIIFYLGYKLGAQ